MTPAQRSAPRGLGALRGTLHSRSCIRFVGARVTVGDLRLENFTVGALPQGLQDHSGYYWDGLLPPYQT